MLRQGTVADLLIRWGFFFAVDLMIGYACFLACVTWLDWVGIIPYFFVLFGVWFSRCMFFLVLIVLLVALRAVLRSVHMARLRRTVLVLGILWLLVLPFIPWKAEKALITGYILLVPGMTTTQVQMIMSMHPGVHTPGVFQGHQMFCDDCQEGGYGGSYVHVDMTNDRLVSAEIDLD